MGAIIEAVHGARARRWPVREGSVAVAARAAKRTLKRAGCDSTELGVLINTGVHRDGNIVEPAMAPFVQHRIGANPSCPAEGGPDTFSFDLTNGGTGVLNAVQIVDGLLRSGRVRRGMVVTSDVDPTPGVSRGLSFVPAGAALLLAPGEEGEGFSDFHFESFPRHAKLLRSGIQWAPEETTRRGTKNHAVISEEDPQYMAQCVDCAERATRAFLDGIGLEASDLDLVIPSQHPAGFPRGLRERLKIDSERLVDTVGRFGATYTAGPLLGLHDATVHGSWHDSRNVLFVCVGAGINVALALYRRPLAAPDGLPRA